MAEDGFHDYTLATNLERLVAQLEQCFRGWMLTGLEHISHMSPAVGADKHPTNVVRVSNNLKHRLPWREQPYILTLHVPYTREAELQAARQQQQHQQRLQQDQQQQAIDSSDRSAAAAAATTTAEEGSAAAVAVPAADQASATAAASAGQTSSAATPAEQQQQQQDILQQNNENLNKGAGSPPFTAAAAANSGGSSEQLDQRVQDLIEEYRQLHLQLQEDDDTEQQQQQEQEEVGTASRADSAASVDVAQVQLQLGSSIMPDATAAAAGGGLAEPQAQSAVAAIAVGAAGSVAPPGRTVKPPPVATAEAAVSGAADSQSSKSPGLLKTSKVALPGLRKLISSSSTAAAAAADEAPSESEESDENNTRQVDLPVADDLALPNSTAVAAAQAAVRQDQSRTAVSRTWWPHCFAAAAAASSSAPAAAGRARIPSSSALKPPWWVPVASIHKLQRWFGFDLFVTLQPTSFSRRFLDPAEASSLLSVGRLSLSSGGVMWPLLLPVHDALRDAYCGVAQVGGSSVYFISDSIHVSRLPRHLTTPHQQISVFADQLAPHNAAAAAACLAALGHTAAGSTSSDRSQYVVLLSACCTFKLPDVSKMHWLQQQQQQQRQHRLSQVQSYPGSSRSSFSSDGSLRNPSALHSPYPAGLRHPRFDEGDLDGLDWDADSAWHPWAQQRDPITTLELDLIWEDRQIADPDEAPMQSEITSNVSGHSLQNSEADQQQQKHWIVPAGGVISAGSAVDLLSNVSSADHWVLHVVAHGYSSAPIRQGRLGMRSANRHRRHVSLAAAGAEWLWTADLAQQVLSEGGRLSGVCPQPYNYNPGSGSSSSKRQAPLDPGSFTTMLSALMTARTAAMAASSLWELAGADWWESRGESAVPPLPPQSVLDSVIRDLFSPPKPFGSIPTAAAGSSGSSTSSRRGSTLSSAEATAGSSYSSDLPRSAPVGSLLCRLALHALVFGNARAIAALWQRFVAQIRLQFWEQRSLLPYMHAGGQQQQQQLTRSGSSSSSHAAPSSDLPKSRSQTTKSGLSNVMGGPPAPDLDGCLLYQKLQMLNVCIWRRDKRLSRGSSLQQQQQQQLNAAFFSSAATAAAAGSDLIGDSSSVRGGLVTAASSSFFSAAGDEDDLAAAEEEDQEEVTSPQQQQQQQQSSDNFIDIRSEDNSVTSSTNGTDLMMSDNGRSGLQQQQWQQPEGVDRIVPSEFLLNFPDRPLRVPIVQEDPVFTEDQIIERQTALMQLAEASAAAAAAASPSSSNRLLIASAGVAAPEDAAAADAELLLVRQRLLAAPLLSDMSSFKAANLGCCLEDFLRWYSPKDWLVQQQQQQRSDELDHPHCSDRPRSPRSKVSATSTADLRSDQIETRSDPGSWQNLWTLAPPLPAAAQRPLLNPNKEGEQVLHYLETIRPDALFSQLLAAAVNEALELLNTSRGAALPAAAAVVSRFRSMAAAVLRKGGGISEALAAAAPQQQQQQHLAGDWQGAESGLSDIELELLLAEFHYVEQVVVLGESLLCHLPSQRDLAARVLDHLVQGFGSSSSSSDLIRSAGDLSDDHAAESRVLGAAGFLPVARLSRVEALGLLKWVAAAAQRPSAATAARQWQQQQQQDSSPHGMDPGLRTDTNLQDSAAGAAGLGQDDLLPSGTAAAAPVPSSSSSSNKEWQQIQELQRHLVDPAHREWVLTCSRSVATAANASSCSSSSSSSRLKLTSNVAAAVAAAIGAGCTAAAAPVPPSRMYLQEADGEMRMAFTLVSDTSV